MKKSSKKTKQLNYDLACGSKKQKGYLGVDIDPKTKADIIWDLNKYPWEFAKDNSTNNIFCSHYIQHLQGKDFYNFFDECYRILKPGGQMYVVAPYYTSIRAIQDAFHKTSISEHTFAYLTKNWRKTNRLDSYNIKCDFEIVKIDYGLTDEFKGKSQEATIYAIRHFFNVVDDIIATLKKSK